MEHARKDPREELVRGEQPDARYGQVPEENANGQLSKGAHCCRYRGVPIITKHIRP